MGGESLFGALVGMGGGALLGVLVALSVKVIRQQPNLPGWPILLFAFLGGMLPALLQHWRNS